MTERSRGGRFLATSVALGHWLSGMTEMYNLGSYMGECRSTSSTSSTMDEILTRWRTVVTQAAIELGRIDGERARCRPADGKWSAAEIVGHLIDSAINNYCRFVEAQLRPDLVFAGYDQDAWVRVQAYQTADWPALVQLWAALNQRLIAVVVAMSPEALSQPRSVHNLDQLGWRAVSRDEVTTLRYFIADYIGHLEHHLAQIRGRVVVPAGAA